MRLLHTRKLEFGEFYGRQIPDYAMLSHRWTSDEVSFQDFYHSKNGRTSNFLKIRNCCFFVKQYGFDWVWIDTCCIDKSSSAEITEAINSMFKWYRNAKMCYAYLADVSMNEDKYGNWERSRKEFLRSAWFTRGWTLQELLAPKVVTFVDRQWQVIGSKGSYHPSVRELSQDISHATGIPADDMGRPLSKSVAQKLSWLSHRETTREEDMAYCMLGMFGINMPLLYGEGSNAFVRLQIEIIRTSDDESIFAWFSTEKHNDTVCGILAGSPKAFAHSGNVVHRSSLVEKLPYKLPYTMTNKGLQYQIPKPPRRTDKRHRYGDTYSLLLDCTIQGKEDSNRCVTITLFFDNECWWRKDCGKLFMSQRVRWIEPVERGYSFETLYIRIQGCPSPIESQGVLGQPSDEDHNNSADGGS